MAESRGVCPMLSAAFRDQITEIVASTLGAEDVATRTEEILSIIEERDKATRKATLEEIVGWLDEHEHEVAFTSRLAVELRQKAEVG